MRRCICSIYQPQRFARHPVTSNRFSDSRLFLPSSFTFRAYVERPRRVIPFPIHLSRRKKWLLSAILVPSCLYMIVDYLTAFSLTRSLRTGIATLTICYLYKFTTPQTAEEYQNLHKKAARIFLNVCLKNEGLYIKFGQGINSMSHVLPSEVTDILSVLLDKAPAVPVAEIKKILKQETGKDVEELFEDFEDTPAGSASIAQVHRAYLRPRPGEGDSPLSRRVVAVKVQKPHIPIQAKWDILTYRAISYLLEKTFSLPLAWATDTIVEGLEREMNFVTEANNAERCRACFGLLPSSDSGPNEKDLTSQFYIPIVYHSLSSPKILVMEWVEAVKLLDQKEIKKQFNEKKVLTILFHACGDMIFKHGFVHCDPHPANVLVRKRPSLRDRDEKSKQEGFSQRRRSWRRWWWGDDGRHSDFQVVLIDFGLCVPESEKFRLQYALLFKSMFTHDMASMEKIVRAWGISDAAAFASIQLQKPYNAFKKGSKGELTPDEVAELQREAHHRAQTLLQHQHLIPKELPLVGRGVQILRGINRLYGSPIDRVGMFAQNAVQSLGPLGDFEGIERYIEILQTIKKGGDDNGNKQKDNAAVPVSQESSDGTHDGATPQVFSIYDEEADRLRREQAVAVQAYISSMSRVHYLEARILAFYNAIIFQMVMHLLEIYNETTKWINWFLLLLFPSSEGLHIETLEDCIDKMQESMRIN